MRIVHTADWHIGQSLNGWSRDEEHRIWLLALADLIEREEIDVLLIAGDVFDGINPSGESQALFYGALRTFRERRPRLRTIITSGNHDPAGRLQAPAPVLAALDVHVHATLHRTGPTVEYRKHLVPLTDPDGTTRAWVCAIPFLRAADLPGLSFATGEARGSPIVEAARRLHDEMARTAREVAGDLPVLAMGHLHCHGATESEGAERRILIGGEHAVPEDIFPDSFDYVALGHLHRPQSLAGGRIRYSGSCFPLSAAEQGYPHGVTVLDLEDGKLRSTHHPMPRPAEMLRLPVAGVMTFDAFEDALARLDGAPPGPQALHPLLYVNLEATGPAAVLLAEAEKLIARAPVRVAGIKVRRILEDTQAAPVLDLDETTPEQLFIQAFRDRNACDPDEAHVAAFREAETEA